VSTFSSEIAPSKEGPVCEAYASPQLTEGFGPVLGGAAIDKLVVQSSLLLISVVLFIAIAVAAFRAFTNRDK
jgi:hypothetical protein